MSLVGELENLINDIGRGLTESAIRNRLIAVRDQAEAADTALKRCETALEDCNSALHDARADLERLKSDAEQEKLPPEDEPVDEIGKQLLRTLAQPYWYVPVVAEMAELLGIPRVEAQYHIDKLLDKGLVEKFGRSSVKLTAKGRAYVVENKLV
jgi:DNA-binding transcriptional ArsR family regulator